MTVMRFNNPGGQRFETTTEFGHNGISSGQAQFSGATSGTVIVQVPAVAGAYNFNLPLTSGSAGQPLLSGGGVAASQTYGTLGPAAGGTGVANNAANTITFTGNFSFGATLTGNTSVTFPTSGTLATTAGASLPAVVQGDLLYGSAASTLSALAKNPTASRYLSNSGTSNNPAWAQVDLTNGVTGTLPVANGGTSAVTPQAAMAALKGVYVLGASAVQVTHTGDTAETTLATIAVPANAMGANGILRITAQMGYSGGTGSWTPRIRFGGTAFLDPSTFGNTSLGGRIQTQIANRNATNSQVGTGPLQINWAGSATAPVTAALDTTGALDITITGQLATSTDTVKLESYLVELIVP